MSKTSRILQLCARIEPQPIQYHLLLEACTGFGKWNELWHKAEEQGMGPLLYKHLSTIDSNWPDSFYRSLMLSVTRHRQANALLMKSLTYILELLEAEGIPVIVLKGAALCQTLYPDIGLRPMRDIDLLLSKEDVQHAHTFLQQNGFHCYSAVMPEDHFHLPPLYQSTDGVQICVELHHDLFPSCPPYSQSFSFVEVYRDGHVFDAGGVTAYMFGTEEMLYHLFEHGFHAPLTYEPYKLISLADIVGLVEEKVAEIDWVKVESRYPQLFHALPFFHYITPWSDSVLENIPRLQSSIPSGVGKRFTGWPRVRLATQKDKNILNILRHTFFPPQWWMMVYYTPVGLLSVLWCRVVRHPKHIFWWVKLYWSIFLQANLPKAASSRDANRGGIITSSFNNTRILFMAMYRKFK